MQGKIIKGIAGFYYVHIAGKGVYECKAKGIFRKNKIKPLVGDDVVDRFLISMERQNVPVVVCFNKSDIAEPQEAARLQEIYENCGCQVLFTSVKEQAGTEQIRELLKDKTTVVAGPSGVGKSSMINFLYPKAEMMDTPGFSSLYLTDFEKEDLKEYFAEFRKYEPYCRFQGCMHLSEPDCGVKEALAEGKISSIRYESYKELYEELKQKRRY